jgi:hypothetical protein
MNIFESILEKLGLKKPETGTTPEKPSSAAPVQPTPTPASKPAVSLVHDHEALAEAASAFSHKDSRPVPASVAAKPVQPAAPAPVPSAPVEVEKDVAQAAATSGPAAAVATHPAMEMVDVVAKLNKLAKDSGQPYDWKASIVDLLKLLHIDSSLEARKQLAQELDCPPELMKDKDSRNMNIWLHKTVMQKLAENGGNVPRELID